MNLAGDGENSGERLFDHALEASFFVFLHLSADLLVLVLTVRSLGQVLLEALDTFTTLEFSEHLGLLWVASVCALGVSKHVTSLGLTILTGQGKRESMAQLWQGSHGLEDIGEV